jgi:hypothetical protein
MITVAEYLADVALVVDTAGRLGRQYVAGFGRVAASLNACRTVPENSQATSTRLK